MVAAGALILQSVLDWHPAERTAGELVLAAVGVALFATAFVRLVSATIGFEVHPAEQVAELAMCVSFATGMLLLYGAAWSSLSALAGGASVLGLRRRRRLVMPPALLVLTFVCTVVHGAGAAVAGGVVVQQLLTTVAVGGLGLLASFALEVEHQRAEQSRLLVAEERLQFSRNLHDVVGRSLSVIALKCEVVQLLLRKDPRRAGPELEQIGDLTRKSVADMRHLVRGYREMSAVDELTQVAEMLELAGVYCDCDGLPPALPEQVQETVGWLIREAGTNIVRHAKATMCAIRIRLVDDMLRVTVCNDGAYPPPDTDVEVCDGTGLVGQRERLAGVGGSLLTRHAPDGTFTLRAEIPVHFVEVSA